MSVTYILWLVKKWYWLIILAALIGGGVALGVNHVQPKVYAATTTMYVSSPNHNDYQTVLGAQQAAKAFTLFPTSDKVLQATIAAAGNPHLTLSQLSSMISVQNTLNTQFVSITVSTHDPQLAAQLASEIATQSMAQFMASQTTNIQNQQFIQQQMNKLQTEINSLQQQLTQAQLGTPTPAKIKLVDGLTSKLNLDQQYYGQLLNSQNGISGFQVSLVQKAEIPTNPVGLSKVLAVVIGVLIGLIVIICVILFMEHTKDIMVIHPGDQIMVFDQETGSSNIITIKDLHTKEIPKQNAKLKLHAVIPRQVSGSTEPVTPRESVALNSRTSEYLQTRELLEKAQTMQIRRVTSPKQFRLTIAPDTPIDGPALNGYDPKHQARG